MISRASDQLVLAKERLKKSLNAEWNDPTDIQAKRQAKFWESEVARFSQMDPDKIIPMF